MLGFILFYDIRCQQILKKTLALCFHNFLRFHYFLFWLTGALHAADKAPKD